VLGSSPENLTRAELEERTGEIVNDKRLRRLLGKWDLSLHRTVSRPKPSPVRRLISEAWGHLNLVRDTDPGALETLSTDFTELRYDGGDRKAWLIGFLDLESSWMAGWAVGPSPNRTLDELQAVVEQQMQVLQPRAAPFRPRLPASARLPTHGGIRRLIRALHGASGGSNSRGIPVPTFFGPASVRGAAQAPTFAPMP